MLIDFTALPEAVIPHMYGGEGEVHANMYASPAMKIMKGKLPPGASIGLHPHKGSSEIVYILSGTGKALCQGETESLVPGSCHYCPQGQTHSLINDSGEDLVFFAVVPEQK